MKKTAFALLLLLITVCSASAAIHTETILYKDGEVTLEGFLAYDDNSTATRPGILVVHDWMGLDDNAKLQATKIAGLGYIALAADIYGKSVRPKNAAEASAEAGKYKTDIPLLRSRVKAALEALRSQKTVNPVNVAAIGYCFGGTGVLELARSGADLRGVASFHGGLGTTSPGEPGSIKAKVLVLHGADDPFSPMTEVTSFNDEMKKNRADYQIHLFGGAVHSFTRLDADGTIPGAKYDQSADLRSWELMKLFFAELFKTKS